MREHADASLTGMTPAKQPPPKSLLVRIDHALVDRVDALRGPLVPREPFIRQLLTQAVEAEEKAAKKRGKR